MATAVVASVVGIVFIALLVAVPWLGRRATAGEPKRRRAVILVVVAAVVVIGGGLVNRGAAREATLHRADVSPWHHRRPWPGRVAEVHQPQVIDRRHGPTPSPTARSASAR